MSFLRHFFPEDFAKPPRAAASPRVRSFKGFALGDVGALQEPLLTLDPTYWCLTVVQAAGGVGTFGYGGVQTPDDPTLFVIVDEVVVDGRGLGDYIPVDVNVDGVVPPVLVNDQNVWVRNRRSKGTSGVASKAGLIRIHDNPVLQVGTQIAHALVTANGPAQRIPVGYVLFGNEQLLVHNSTANQPLDVTIYGRLSRLQAR